MNTERNKIRSFVSSNESPSVLDFYKADAPNFEMLQYLLKMMSSLQVSVSQVAGGGHSFKSLGGDQLLVIDHQGNVAGSLAPQLPILLMAIRLHEVESYEWSYYTPDMRRDLIDNAAKKMSATPADIKRMTGTWVNNE
jgi:hypothetical protein